MTFVLPAKDMPGMISIRVRKTQSIRRLHNERQQSQRIHTRGVHSLVDNTAGIDEPYLYSTPPEQSPNMQVLLLCACVRLLSVAINVAAAGVDRTAESGCRAARKRFIFRLIELVYSTPKDCESTCRCCCQ